MDKLNSCISFLNKMNFVLLVALIGSLGLNIYYYIELKRYQMNDSTYKAKWQELMGIHNPINIILWTIAIFSLLVYLGYVFSN